MAGVLQNFLLASVFMWIAPIAILYGFNYQIIPGSSQLSPSSQTLISGFVAVISVNVVIVLYIIMAMKEPTIHEPQPDPTFLADAKASINQSATTRASTSDPTFLADAKASINQSATTRASTSDGGAEAREKEE